MTIRVVVVDDHPVVREGLRAVLAAEDDIDVVGACATGEEAVRAAVDLSADVVVMDLRMPGMDGAEATARITAASAASVLVLTTYDTDADILRAVEAGASGYLLKNTPPDAIADAVRSAARGETVLAPPVAARLVTRLRAAPHRLTTRETEILRCVARGLSNVDIGRALFITEATVKSHLISIFGKLGMNDRTAAVVEAVTRGTLILDRQ